jgi:hypothetical protein
VTGPPDDKEIEMPTARAEEELTVMACGCRVEIADDGLHVFACSPEHEAIHEQVCSEFSQELGIPFEIAEDPPLGSTDILKRLKVIGLGEIGTRLIGCEWGRGIKTAQDPHPCIDQAVQCMVIHAPPGVEPREALFQFCQRHFDYATESPAKRRAAFRLSSNRLHPDKEGGDQAKFVKLQAAKDLLDSLDTLTNN